MVFLPHTNTVILLEPYCGTMTEPGLPVGIQGIQGIHGNTGYTGYTWVYRVYKVYMVYRVYIENTSWKVLCTVFTHSLFLYQKSYSLAALTRSISDTSTTRA